MKYFLLSIVTAVASLFGLHSQSIQQATSTLVNIEQAQTYQSTDHPVTQTSLANLSSTTKQQIANGTKDIAIENNVKGTRDFITEYYKSDSNPCMNKYVIDSIKTSTVGQVTCQSNAISYAVSQALVSAPTASWCADSSGFTNQGATIYQNGKYFCTATNVSIPVIPRYSPPSTTANQASGGQSQAQTNPDVIIKSRLNMARNAAELYYNTSNSYSGYCATDKNYKDIRDSVAPINISCKDSPTAYAISSLIKGGGNWCVDSTGYTGNIISSNTQTYCAGQLTSPNSTQPTPSNTTNSSNTIRIPVVAVPSYGQSSQPSQSTPKEPAVTIIAPTGAGFLYMGNSYTIAWVNPPSQPTSYSVYLDNNADVGVSSLYLGSVSSSQQMFAFKVPSNVQPGNQFQIHLMYASNGNVVASSPLFTIASQ